MLVPELAEVRPGVWAGVLRFEVLPGVVFSVSVLGEMPRGADGEACHGVCDWESREVRLWAGLDGVRRRHVMLHELQHAKRYFLGVATDAETDCDTSAAFWGGVMQQLEDQGGLMVLAGLVPPEVAEIFAAEALTELDLEGALLVVKERETEGRVVRELTLEPVTPEDGERTAETRVDRLAGGPTADCSVCERVFGAGEVWTGRSYWCTNLDGRLVNGEIVERSLYCPDCGEVQGWFEGWDPVFGKPNGALVTDARRTRDGVEIARHAERVRAMKGARTAEDAA